ncbi:nucleotidyltransferase domain-containing protein [Sutcliffiella deserti]|uniref:nucleotidyltransferase domain-containing protein n=1 Tax=Sutcliffiella deserti TaxID=2875501 RepID=UPI001CBEC58D|nr:nucleotidyltransferase domain-containing protein [Sutcliffiella deserti]
MTQAVHTLLEQMEQDYKIKILYACEAGSRAYGVATSDSDYDIRMIYVSPLKRYLSLKRDEDTITYFNSKWDIQGWDVQKALTLALKSNPSLYEWMQSPICYIKEPAFFENLKGVTSEFSTRTLAEHYWNMARRNHKLFDKKGDPTFLFHALRATLMVEKLLVFSPPSINVTSLAESSSVFDKTELQQILSAKYCDLHNNKGLNSLLNKISVYLQEIEKEVSLLPSTRPAFEHLNDLFYRQLGIN